jgi:hypothetical protein
LKICNRCGVQNVDKNNFCLSCGAQLPAGDVYSPQNNGNVHSQAGGNFVQPVFRPMPTYYNPYTMPPVAPRPYTPLCGMGVAGMVVAIVSYFYVGFLIFPQILAMIFSGIAISRCNQGQRGRGFAIAGMINAVVSLVLYLIVWIAIIAGSVL